MKRIFGFWIGRKIDLRDPALHASVRCSWCEEHGFACGEDTHAIANAARETWK